MWGAVYLASAMAISSPVPDPRRLAAELKGLTRLAAPVAFVQLGMMALGVVDVAMVGHVSERALASVSLGHTFTFALMIVGMGVLHVLDPLVAQAYGAGDRQAQLLAIQRGLVLALMLSVPLAAAIAAGRPLLLLLSGQPEVVPYAHGYALAIAPGLPAFFVFLVLRQTVQAMSVVRPVIIAVVIANVANVFLNLAFVHGRFGFPAMGPVGSGVASTICRFLMAAVIAFAAWPVLRPLWRAPDRALLRPGPYLPMLARGLHIGVQMSLEVWLFNAVAILMVRMGTLELAGHAVAMNLAAITFMIPLGIGAAASTRVGNAIGRADLAGARLSSRVALAMGGAVMVLSGATFMLFPEPLASLYTDDAAVIGMASTLLPIAGLFQVFDGTQAVGAGVLRGAGDTRVPAIISFIGFWVLGLPAGCLLAYVARLGPAGLWGGLTVGLAAVAVLLVLRIRKTLGGDGVIAVAVASDA